MRIGSAKPADGRKRARFSSWHELFPRSTSPNPGHHGTFLDVEQQIPEIAKFGFDILYRPPFIPLVIHFQRARTTGS
jgi:starch synthase (maltosyl-transferring)